ncbi:MAG: FHA domain-containing protein [Anaerolineae bacterium]|nr:FHA domain-containing protein [Anaerolineae bacterium]
MSQTPNDEHPKTDLSEDPRLATHHSSANATETGVLSIPKDKRPRFGLNSGVSGTGRTGLLGEESEIIFVIRGIVERVVIPKSGNITLGRSDPRTRTRVDLDLTPYGALDRGVSREHVRMHIEDGKLYVTDLGSTNGTFLANVRLEANTPTALRKGDELLLGRLPIQVLFR